jgi:adenine-specific DNA methylase
MSANFNKLIESEQKPVRQRTKARQSAKSERKNKDRKFNKAERRDFEQMFKAREKLRSTCWQIDRTRDLERHGTLIDLHDSNANKKTSK